MRRDSRVPLIARVHGIRGRLEFRNQARAGVRDTRPGGEERLVKGRDFPPARRRGFQQEIAGTESPLVVPQSMAVGGVPLRRHEVQKPPSRLRPAAHDFDIAVREIHHASDPEVVSRRLLLHFIERELLPLAAQVKLQVPLAKIAIHDEPAALVLDRMQQPA